MPAGMVSSRNLHIERLFPGVDRLRSQLQSVLYRECSHVRYASICINQTIPQLIFVGQKYFYDASIEVHAHHRSSSNPARCINLAEASYIVMLIG